MFKNIGRKIKSYAKVVFAIGVILSVISSLVGAFAVGALLADASGEVFLGILAGFFLFVVSAFISCLFAYLSVMFIYGYGDLIDNTEYIKKYTEDMYYRNSINRPATPVAPTPAPAPSPAPAPQPAPRPTSQPVSKPAGPWRCTKCGGQNEPGDAFCRNCGAPKN